MLENPATPVLMHSLGLKKILEIIASSTDFSRNTNKSVILYQIGGKNYKKLVFNSQLIFKLDHQTFLPQKQLIRSEK